MNLAKLPAKSGLDPMLVERVRMFYQKVAHALRELEAYKLRRGICTAGISCTRKAVEGTRACPHHAAARKAGLKLRRWEAYESEYGRLRKVVLAAERAARKKAPKKKVRKAA